jgi:serine/threonine-protein kinase
MSETDENALIGRLIAGKYRIAERVGVGGMGAVYRARHEALDRLIAIKIMHRHVASEPSFAARFRREAQLASRIDHPSSIQVLDFGTEPDGTSYLAMELVEGRDLVQLLASEAPLSPARIVDILSQALAALAVAHELGVIHRDIKLENLLVVVRRGDDGATTDLVKVCDFGIAKLQEPEGEGAVERGRTTGGIVLGTPEFMSPEQARGEVLDARSDLYAIGVVLYEMLTGELPFVATTALAVVLKQLHEAPLPPSVRAPSVHPELAELCLRVLSKRREDRPSSARELRSLLRAAIGLEDAVASARAGARPGGPSASSSRGIAPTEAFPLVERAGPERAQAFRRRALVAGGVLVFAASALLVGTRSAPGVTHAKGDAQDGRASRADEGTRLDPRTEVGVPSSSSSAAASSRGALVPASVVDRATAPVHDPQPDAIGAALAAVTTSPSAMRPAASIGPVAAIAQTGQTAQTAQTAAITPTVSASAPLPATAASAIAVSNPAVPATSSPAPAFSADKARVDIATIATTAGISGSNVRAAVARAPLTRCYRDALAKHGARVEGTVKLHLSIDDTGRVTAATASGASPLTGLGACFERGVTGLTIRDVDTGDAVADVSLTLVLP